MGGKAFTPERSYANETWNKSIVETVSSDGTQHIAVTQWRGGCSEKLDIHIRYSQRDEWIDGGLMPRKLLHKLRVNEDSPIDARVREADEEDQTVST